MSNRVLERNGGANSQSELDDLRDLSEEELKEFLAALLTELKILAHIARLPRVEYFLRLTIENLSADEEHPAPGFKRGTPRSPLT